MEKSNQGPWQQLDPAKLKLEAERKEAKLKRQQEQRIIRAAERKEKRQLKSEAKQARKANVRRAGKWTEERRAEDKIKKALNKPHKEEKRYRRLLSRADRLEVQALTLMKQAQQARARYAVMTEQRAKVAAEKDKELNEIMNPEGGNFIEVPEVEGEKASGDVEMTNGTHDSEAAQHVEPVEEPVEELAEDKKSSKKPKKSKSKKDKPSEPENAISEIIAEASTAAQEEPKDIGTEDFIALEDEDKSKEKKKKKKKSKSDEAATDEVNGETSTATEKKVEKKRKREAGVDAETEAVATTNGIEDASETPKEKKHKKKKAKKADAGTEGYVTKLTENEETNADGAEQWNVEALGGGDARKQKFLRLLGAKKTGNSGETAGASQAGHSSSKKQITNVQNDLERQFEAGMRKKDQGRKRGLGA